MVSSAGSSRKFAHYPIDVSELRATSAHQQGLKNRAEFVNQWNSEGQLDDLAILGFGCRQWPAMLHCRVVAGVTASDPAFRVFRQYAGPVRGRLELGNGNAMARARSWTSGRTGGAAFASHDDGDKT